jgi:hypothetical protein
MSATSGVGMPHALRLEQFGAVLADAFDEVPYQVGSSLPGYESDRPWRDVDVRVILDDAVYEAMGFGDPERTHCNAKWVAYTLAFSALGKEMTGLPIDFQVQQLTYANTKHGKGHPRSALGLRRRLVTP